MPWRWGHHGKQAGGAGVAAEVSPGDVEGGTQVMGRELLEAMGEHGRRLGSRRFWADQIVAWAMGDEGFKTELFRFIDVYPVLRTAEAVGRHLREYLERPGISLPTGMGVALAAGRMMPGKLAETVKGQVETMAGRFIGGRDAGEALGRLRGLWDAGMGFSVDLLGEACVSELEAAAYRQRYINLVMKLSEAVREWPASENGVLEEDHLGPVPRANVSLKISALDPRIRVADEEGTVERMLREMRPLLEAARDENVLINFDMEQFELSELTMRLFMRCCEEIDFPAGIALQAYLTSAERTAERLIDWAKRVERVVSVRLIKGAYWDYEVAHAEKMNWAAPVWRRKEQTDACFERLTQRFIDAMPVRETETGVKLAVGTHNVRSVAHAMACLKARGLPASCVEFQVLHGMAEELGPAIAGRGYRVREYVPLGEMVPGMAYLVRRLLENTSNQSWLRASAVEHEDAGVLLAAPGAEGMERAGAGRMGKGRERAMGADEFRNEPLRDFSEGAVREAFGKAVAAAEAPVIAIDATAAELEEAIGKAAGSFGGWRDRAAAERCGIVRRAAGEMRKRRDGLAGLIVRETGKTWGEADADVCEAIDFCEFYAREAMGILVGGATSRLMAERNELWHEGRGVAAVISPWNFPLSIPTGMTAAALVMGNTVVLKPAEQSPGTAMALCDALWRAGVPGEVLRFVPGRGETLGAALVRDGRVAVVAFTGSAAVGMDILQASRAKGPGTEGAAIKQVIAEMGGKNAIIVDGSADLDEAVLGVRDSAFSYAGQKCSACSRVMVMEEVAEVFVGRLLAATKALSVGDPILARTDMGPLIDEEAGRKVRRYIEAGRAEARLAHAGGELGAVRGKPLIGPHIFVDVPVGAAIAREEIFGPVLSVFAVKSFEEGLALANSSAYRLTGGVFSRTPSHLELARREFRVGNLYLNRGITGAVVGRQPFGGFGMSGLGTKAGGREYLLGFGVPRVVTENTLRHGFVPGEMG